MKKIFLLAATAVCLLSFNQVKAQDSTTASTATKSRGYTVLNKNGAVTMYKYQHQSHSAKDAAKYLPKYYFSTASSDVLQLLTKDNLKKAYPENHAFHDALDATLKSDADLTSYDTFHKMYKVNWLLQQHS